MSLCACHFKIVSHPASGPKILVIKDLGPWDSFSTVTNDAENVVEKLFQEGHLKRHQRLLYIDSDNQLGELLIVDGKFKGFAFVDPDGEPA